MTSPSQHKAEYGPKADDTSSMSLAARVVGVMV